MHPKEEAARALINNRRQAEQIHGVAELVHTPPSPEHYLHKYLWDSGFFVIMYAQTSRQLFGEGRHEEAAKYRESAHNELMAVLSGQHDSGMIPNVQFIKDDRSWDFERIFAVDKQAKSSGYSQPPILPLATADVLLAGVEAGDLDATKQLEEAYPYLEAFMDYFNTYRSNSEEDKLIGVIHPHETGRDSDPTFDFMKRLRLKRKGEQTSKIVDIINTPIDYFYSVSSAVKLHRRAKDEIQKARELFWVNDVMFNCIYVDNLRALSELAKYIWRPDRAKHYERLADKVETQISQDMFFGSERDGAGVFYALGKDKKPIKEVSISNLFPLTLHNLPQNQLRSILDLMDKSFNTPFPLPSVATDSPNYDPHNQEKERLWRGPVWINMNWYLTARGLRIHAERENIPAELRSRCREWDERITAASKEMVRENGACEHYDPATGKGQRGRVKNFGWSWLANFM